MPSRRRGSKRVDFDTDINSRRLAKRKERMIEKAVSSVRVFLITACIVSGLELVVNWRASTAGPSQLSAARWTVLALFLATFIVLFIAAIRIRQEPRAWCILAAALLTIPVVMSILSHHYPSILGTILAVLAWVVVLGVAPLPRMMAEYAEITDAMAAGEAPPRRRSRRR